MQQVLLAKKLVVGGGNANITKQPTIQQLAQPNTETTAGTTAAESSQSSSTADNTTVGDNIAAIGDNLGTTAAESSPMSTAANIAIGGTKEITAAESLPT